MRLGETSHADVDARNPVTVTRVQREKPITQMRVGEISHVDVEARNLVTVTQVQQEKPLMRMWVGETSHAYVDARNPVTVMHVQQEKPTTWMQREWKKPSHIYGHGLSLMCKLNGTFKYINVNLALRFT